MSHFSAVQNVAEYYRNGLICFCDKRTSFAYGNSDILSRNIDREAMSQSSISNVKSHTSQGSFNDRAHAISAAKLFLQRN